MGARDGHNGTRAGGPFAWSNTPTPGRDLSDLAFGCCALVAATLVGLGFDALGLGTCVVIAYVVAVQVTALVTIRRLHCLLGSISHDLRTPLTAIAGNADVLLSDAAVLTEGQRAKLAADIRSDATWLTSTVENLLAITKLENGGMSLNATVELMDDIIEEALRHVDPAVSEHVLTVESSPDVALVSVDARLMVQVVVNLVNNAVTHTPAGSRIAIRAWVEGARVRCSVADDGPGIPEADRARIFESFYTVNHGLADGRRSVGLGLSLCSSIMAAHGGAIGVSAVEPHGCCFELDLPAYRIPEGEIVG